MTAPEAKAELIRTLDEKFVVNSIAFDAMIAAAALLVEGAIFRLVRGMADHGARHSFAKVTGTWPGEERPEPE